MSSIRQFTPENALEHLRKDAKRWLKALRAGDADARERWSRAVPSSPSTQVPTLRDVQHAIARELGYSGWAALKQATLAGPAPRESTEGLVDRFLENACPDHHVRGKSQHVRAEHTALRLLAKHPEIARHDFATAVVCGDLATVERAIAARPELAFSKTRPQSPYRAMVGGEGDLNADIGGKGWEPLLYLCFTRLPLEAVTENAVAIARLLLGRGANPNVYFMAGDSRYTPLSGVIGEGEEDRPAHARRDELVRLLLDSGAEPYDNQVLYNMGFKGDYLWYLPLIHETSLRLGRAADWDDPEWRMLGMGGYGTGARWQLEHAIKKNDPALLQWCLEHGANPNAAPASDKRFPRLSLYEVAVRKGRHEMAELLIAHGAERVPVALSDTEALVVSCLAMDVEAVRTRLAAHPELLGSHEPLFAAAKDDRAEVIAFLLDLGMSPDVEDKAKQRPLHIAAYANAVSAARVLIERGAAIDPVEGHFGNTPLGGASYYRHREMIELLSRYSRDVWELTYLGRLDRLHIVLGEEPHRAKAMWNGQTPLMWLPPDDEGVALEIARLYVALGANPTLRNGDGMTAAEIAERIGMGLVAEFLRQASAAWNGTNEDGT